MKIRNLILLVFGLLPFFAASQTATFDRVRVRQGLTIRAEKADSIIRAVTALSNHTSIPTAKAVWDAIAAIVAASKYQTLRDDGSNMTQQPAANFVSTATVAFTLTNDGGNSETEIAASVPTGGITTTEILDGTIANADISSSANIANSKLANSGVTAGTYPSTGGVIPLLTINSKGIITAVSESANVDANATNEGRLGVGAGGSNDALLTSNTSGATGVTYAGGTAISVSETANTNGGTITITNTGDTDGSNDLTVSDTTWRVLSSSTHFKYPTAAAVYNAIIAGGTARPDSAWAKSPSGSYTGKRIADNVYRNGKMGVGTTDTTAMLNLKPPAPDNVNGFSPVLQKIVMPPRRAFAHPTWANGSKVWIQQIDPNAMRPKVDTAFKFGIWEDILVVDSTTNSEVNRPGDMIRDIGFNLSGATPRLAQWGWSTEQYYFDGPRNGQNKMSWEHHLQVRDTLLRYNRPFLLRGLHDGSYYDGGLMLDEFHLSQPFTSRRALHINTATGLWETDAPFAFKMQKDTTLSEPLFSKLHGGAYRNLMHMQPTGRVDVGDIYGVRVKDSLSLYASAGATQAFKITGLGPNNVRWYGKIAQESNLDETYTLTRTGNTNRMSFCTSVGNEYGIGINGNSSLYFRGSVPSTRMVFLSDGNISVNGFSSQTQFTVFQPSLDRNGGIRLNPTTSGNVADIFVNSANELIIHRTNEALRLANSGQLQLPEYTSSAAFPVTPVATAVFGADGKIGTAAYSPLAGTGAANRIAYWSGPNNITSSANLTFNGSKVSANTGTAISTYLSLNPGNNASSTGLNGGLTLFDNGTNNLYGLDMGYAAAFGPRLFTAASADINFAKVISGSTPTTQSDFQNIMTVKGSTSRVGIGTTSPATPLETFGSIRTTGVGTGTDIGAALLEINNTTAVTGKRWQILSGDAGSLSIGNPSVGSALQLDGSTGAATMSGPLTISTGSGTAATVTGRTSGGTVTDIVVGSGLSLSGGTLSATGGGGGTPGGSTTQVQYNNAGAFDGASGLTIDASENVSITQSVFLSGDISPSDISGTANDYAPAGFSTASTLLQTNSNNAVVTGIAGGADGRWITWHNTGANNLIFRNENALSTAANRLLLGGGDVTLRAGGTAGFRYDATASRWRLVYITSFSPSTRVHEFTTGVANYQINIPAGAKGALITGVGGGGGGGSGRKGASATVRCGGGGGASGGIYNMFYPLEGSDAAIMYINVGLGGSGGAAVTANSTNGNAGTAGGETDVRLDGVNLTDRIFRAGGGAGGGGGTASSGTGGTATTVTQIACSAGASASGTGGNGSAPTATLNGTPGPGGSGGGITSANAVGTGGSGAAGAQSLQNGGAANGGAAAAIAKNRDSGGGGGGGNANNTANATTGGAGVRGGGGGGGGAATDSAGNSGAGGAGGDGYLKIIFYF